MFHLYDSTTCVIFRMTPGADMESIKQTRQTPAIGRNEMLSDEKNKLITSNMQACYDASLSLSCSLNQDENMDPLTISGSLLIYFKFHPNDKAFYMGTVFLVK